MNRELTAGSVLGGRYKLIRRLGLGATGVVWLARTPQGTVVTCKVLHALPDERFVAGAEVLSALAHDNIARSLESGTEGRLAFWVTEYVGGRRMSEIIGAQTRSGVHFPGRQVRSLFRQLCEGMLYAHALRVVHQALKPEHIMVVDAPEGPTVKVLDFIHARLPQGDGSIPSDVGQSFGASLYLSPEQVQGHPATAKSDLFAISSILFELITLYRAWGRDSNGNPLPAYGAPLVRDANTPSSVVQRITTEPRPQARRLRPQLPAEIDAFFGAALAVDPSDRPADLAALQRMAEPLLAEIPDEPTLVEPADPMLAERLFEAFSDRPAADPAVMDIAAADGGALAYPNELATFPDAVGKPNEVLDGPELPSVVSMRLTKAALSSRANPKPATDTHETGDHQSNQPKNGERLDEATVEDIPVDGGHGGVANIEPVQVGEATRVEPSRFAGEFLVPTASAPSSPSEDATVEGQADYALSEEKMTVQGPAVPEPAKPTRLVDPVPMTSSERHPPASGRRMVRDIAWAMTAAAVGILGAGLGSTLKRSPAPTPVVDATNDNHREIEQLLRVLDAEPEDRQTRQRLLGLLRARAKMLPRGEGRTRIERLTAGNGTRLTTTDLRSAAKLLMKSTDSE